jgi:hypothetical protein
MYKETVSNFLRSPDGEKSLTMFIYVMHKKLKNYQNELEKVKNKNTSNNTFLKSYDKSVLSLIPSNKRKNNELPENETMPDLPESVKPKIDAFKMMTSNRSSNMINPLIPIKGKQSFLKK